MRYENNYHKYPPKMYMRRGLLVFHIFELLRHILKKLKTKKDMIKLYTWIQNYDIGGNKCVYTK